MKLTCGSIEELSIFCKNIISFLPYKNMCHIVTLYLTTSLALYLEHHQSSMTIIAPIQEHEVNTKTVAG
jgi:hypothetical protein